MYKRIVRAVERNGLHIFVRVFPYILTELNPARIKMRKNKMRRAVAFDNLYGIDTAKCLHKWDTESSENQVHASSYEGMDATEFTEIFDKLNMDFSDYTFIDLGSGKGKALFLASDYPFRQIIGVEFSESLHKIAEQNIIKFGKPHIQTLNEDATTYRLSDGNIVCFLYNPFDDVVMSRVIENIKASPQDRKIVIVYFVPRYKELFDNQSWLRPVMTEYNFAVWGNS